MKKLRTLLTILGCLTAVIVFSASFGGAYATLAGKHGGEIDQETLMEISKIDIQGCAAGSKILDYTLVIYSKSGKREINGSSANMSKVMLKALSQLRSGDRFTFKDMKVRLKTGATQDVFCKEFTVA